MTTLTKREIAENILREAFKDTARQPIAEIVARGQRQGVSRRTLTRAAADLGIREVHNGPYPAFWEFAS